MFLLLIKEYVFKYLSKHLSTLSDISRSIHSCSKAISCMSRSSPCPVSNHSNSVSGSTSAILKKEKNSIVRTKKTNKIVKTFVNYFNSNLVENRYVWCSETKSILILNLLELTIFALKIVGVNTYKWQGMTWMCIHILSI